MAPAPAIPGRRCPGRIAGLASTGGAAVMHGEPHRWSRGERREAAAAPAAPRVADPWRRDRRRSIPRGDLPGAASGPGGHRLVAVRRSGWPELQSLGAVARRRRGGDRSGVHVDSIAGTDRADRPIARRVRPLRGSGVARQARTGGERQPRCRPLVEHGRNHLHPGHHRRCGRGRCDRLGREHPSPTRLPIRLTT